MAKKLFLAPLLRIRIRGICMFLGLADPDPDPLVKDIRTRNQIRVLLLSSKNSKKNIDSYCCDLWLLYDFLSLKNNVNEPSKSNFLWTSRRSLTKIAGSESRSIIQRYGSADPVPRQNFTDPQHYLAHTWLWRASEPRWPPGPRVSRRRERCAGASQSWTRCMSSRCRGPASGTAGRTACPALLLCGSCRNTKTLTNRKFCWSLLASQNLKLYKGSYFIGVFLGLRFLLIFLKNHQIRNVFKGASVPRAQKKKTNALQVPLPRRLSWPCVSDLQMI